MFLNNYNWYMLTWYKLNKNVQNHIVDYLKYKMYN